MLTIAGISIHPGFFNQKPARKELRVSAEPSFKLRKTVVIKPSNLRAKHAMPVIAIVAAFASISTAVGAAAVAGGFFATAAATFATITAIGATVGAIGAVTGNKDLMKIGAIVGIAGAVGGFANSAGFFGDAVASGTDGASSMAGNPTGYQGDSGDVLGASSQPSGMIGANTAADGLAPAAATTDLAAGAGQLPAVDPALAVVPQPIPAPNEAALAPGMAAQTPATPAAADQITANAQGQTLTPPPNNAASATYTDSTGAQQMSVSNTLDPTKPPAPFDNLMGMFGKLGSGVGEWARVNPMLASSIFSGVSSAADPSQRDLRSAQAGYYKAHTDQQNKLTKNMSSVGGVIDWSQIFKTPTGTGMTAQGGK